MRAELEARSGDTDSDDSEQEPDVPDVDVPAGEPIDEPSNE